MSGFSLVSMLVLPVSGGQDMAARAAGLVAALRELPRDAFSKLAIAKAPGVAVAHSARLEELRTQATRAVGALPPLLAAAELDTYEVSESRHAWCAALHDLAQLSLTLGCLVTTFGWVGLLFLAQGTQRVLETLVDWSWPLLC